MNKLNELMNYFKTIQKIETEKKKLAAVKENLDKVTKAIDVMGDCQDPVVDAMCKHWDRLNKEAAVINYRIKILELEVAKHELEEAYAD